MRYLKRVLLILIIVFSSGYCLGSENRPIGVLTCEGLDEYKEYDRKFLSLCHQHQIPAEFIVWNQPHRPWIEYRAIIVLSTWDYCKSEQLNRFLLTLKEIDQADVPLINSLSTILWNYQKSYLQELALKGISIPETIYLSSSELCQIPTLIKERKWNECVLKPTISAGGYNTFRFSADLEEIDSLIKECEPLHLTWMLQPFIEEILTEGEWSFIFIDGLFSHSVLKAPAEGNFLVQPFRGGRIVNKQPDPWMIDEARRILEACHQNPAYARIDVICHRNQLIVIEVELIEPYLYGHLKNGFEETFFTAILRRIQEFEK